METASHLPEVNECNRLHCNGYHCLLHKADRPQDPMGMRCESIFVSSVLLPRILTLTRFTQKTLGARGKLTRPRRLDENRPRMGQ